MLSGARSGTDQTLEKFQQDDKGDMLDFKLDGASTPRPSRA